MPRARIVRGVRPASDSPRNRTVPALGCSRPLMTRSTVDLPAPFGPTMQVRLPSSMLRSTPCKMSPPPYPALTPASSRRVAISGSQVRVEHGRLLAHRVRLAEGNRTSSVQHDNLGAQVHDPAHVVLDDEERDAAFVQAADVLADLLQQRRVDPA